MSTSYVMQHNSDFSDTIFITESALKRLKHLQSHEKKPLEFCVRISVLSGGCSGFQYKFEFINAPIQDDLIFMYDGIKIVTDTTSFQLIKNVTIDYAQELIGAAFTLRNPNVEGSCGCGNSFSI